MSKVREWADTDGDALTDASSMFGDPDSPSSLVMARHRPHPLPMVYAPPIRLSVPFPRHSCSQPVLHPPVAATVQSAVGRDGRQISAKPRAKGAAAIGAGGVLVHESGRVVTMDTPLAWFAVNVPRLVHAQTAAPSAGSQRVVHRAPPPYLSSKDVFHASPRGWVEPGPGSLAKLLPAVADWSVSARRRTTSVSTAVTSRDCDDCATTTVFGEPLVGVPKGDDRCDPCVAAASSPHVLRVARSSERSTSTAVPLLSAVPRSVLHRVFSFLDASVLDLAVVFVSRQWYFVVAQSAALTRTRMTFETQVVYPGREAKGHEKKSLVSDTSKIFLTAPPAGILFYLATKTRELPTAAQLAASPSFYNASMCLHHKVGAKSIEYSAGLVTVAGSTMRSEVSTSRSQPLKHKSTFVNNPSETHDPRHFINCGPSTYVSPNIPFAWVGIYFEDGFQVNASAYALCISKNTSIIPLSWELQGCPDGVAGDGEDTEDGDVDWKRATWRVLHEYSTPASAPASDAPTAGSVMIFQVPRNRWGPMRRFRIVQTSRNSEWGHQLAVSGFELYGQLSRRKKGCP